MSKQKALTEYPDLMRQWDFEKNELNPARLTVGSGTRAWWICDKGHSWKATITNRHKGTGCPFCAGKKVLVGFNDLKTCRPALAKEWDFEKNELTPMRITCGSRKSAWWICNKGHSWKSVIGDRTKGRGCPVCAGKTVLSGFNDLQTLNPELAKEWDYTTNTLLPSQVTLGSEKKVWWICAKGHSWNAMISNRNAGTGCPYCSGTKALDGFNDLQTLNPKLAGEWDRNKNQITPTQVTTMSSKVVWWICGKKHSWKAPVYSRPAGGECPYCVGKRVLEGFNDLQTLNPKLAYEWDFEKNERTPSQVTPGSGKAVWWKCAKGHSWIASICSRVKGNGCPYCSGQSVLIGFNDLQTLNPGLSKEWDYEKNVITPSQTTTGTTKKVWWKCNEGHSWQAQIGSRNRGCECPYCTGRLLLAGFNDLQTLNPELAKEWDYDKNKLNPTRFASGTNKTVWWKCIHGHSWKASVNSRNSGCGCPYCAGKIVLPGFNDLKTLNSRLSDEWDHKKNLLTPSQVTVASGKSVWWKCCKNGHSWKAQIASRSVSGNNCPYCSGQRVLRGFNDLETLNAELANEWDYEKNILTPAQVTSGSGKSVWWKCIKGHSWRATVADRNADGSRCPYCFGAFPYTPRCVK